MIPGFAAFSGEIPRPGSGFHTDGSLFPAGESHPIHEPDASPRGAKLYI